MFHLIAFVILAGCVQHCVLSVHIENAKAADSILSRSCRGKFLSSQWVSKDLTPFFQKVSAQVQVSLLLQHQASSLCMLSHGVVVSEQPLRTTGVCLATGSTLMSCSAPQCSVVEQGMC